LTVMAPSDENECRQMLYTAFGLGSPVAVRYPRGAGPGVAIEPSMRELPIGRGEVKRRGERVAILAFGSTVRPALEAAGQLNATVANMRFVKPLDEALATELAASHELLVTVEENVVAGGAGSAVLECLASRGIEVPVLQLGIPDRFVTHGDPALLLKECALDKEGLLRSIRAFAATPTRQVT
jgi:1-deoxy-D-xylulose-5-phosphate synthase